MAERTNLKMARLAQQMTQEEVAAAIGLQRTTITNLEKGNINGSESTWKKLAALLGQPVEHLWQLAE